MRDYSWLLDLFAAYWEDLAPLPYALMAFMTVAVLIIGTLLLLVYIRATDVWKPPYGSESQNELVMELWS